MILQRILKDVEELFGKELAVKSKRQDLVFARSVYFAVSKKCTKHYLSEIGKLVNRDHATVINGLKIFDNELSKNDLYIIPYNKLIYKYGDTNSAMPENLDIKWVNALKKENKYLKGRVSILKSKLKDDKGVMEELYKLLPHQQESVLNRFKTIIEMESRKVFNYRENVKILK